METTAKVFERSEHRNFDENEQNILKLYLNLTHENIVEGF